MLAALTFRAGLVDDYSMLDGVEFFCGEEAVSKGLRARGLHVFGYDIKKDKYLQDINSRMGYIFALSLALRVRPGGLAWCSRETLGHCLNKQRQPTSYRIQFQIAMASTCSDYKTMYALNQREGARWLRHDMLKQ